MSNLTQISLDFGPEHQAPALPPKGAAMRDGEEEYLAAEGVGVRLKSYKRLSPPGEKPEPANGNLFGNGSDEVEVLEQEITIEQELTMEPAAAEEPAHSPEPKITQQPKRMDRATGKPLPKKGKRGRKSLKQVAAEADLIEIPDDEVLFSKQYYTMGEVSEMFRVNQSLLRFWETEFDILKPRKNKKGDRYFRPVDIKNLHLIYHLLRQKKYTIEGAREFLKKNKKAEERFEVIRRLQEIRAFLLEWKTQL
jgi:DNA-binding transcriptional MerR regulator